jgi:putative transposase
MPGLGTRDLLPGYRGACEFDAIIAAHGRRPGMSASDNGTKPTSMAILRSSQEMWIHRQLHRNGKRQQNAFIESFNGRLCDELLNETLLTSLAQSPRLD